MPPPLEFQSSPKVARSKSDAAVQGRQANGVAATQSYSEEKAVSQFKSITNSSSSFTQNVAQESKSFDKSSPRMPVAGDGSGRLAGSTAAEADLFLEELMEEAKRDPSFGVVPGMGRNNGTVEPRPERGATERFNYLDPNNNHDMSLGQEAADPDQSPRRGRDVARHPPQPQHKHGYSGTRAYRTNLEDSINRSRSADGRLFKPFANRDPKLNNFQRTGSTENLAGEMMQEVVTDQQHRSVKDLVAKLETSTKSESEHPYVRRWGCDLISPEPRRRDVTGRYQKKQMPDPEFAHKLQYSMSDYGSGSRVHSRNRNLSETSHDSHEPFLDNYTTDIDDLVDRQHGEQDIDLVFQDLPQPVAKDSNPIKTDDNKQNSFTTVEWPPRTESQSQFVESRADNYVHNTSVQNYSQNSASVNTTNQMSFKQSSNYAVNESEHVAKKKKAKKNENSEVYSMNSKNTKASITNGSRKYDRNSLIELDNQIMDIQSQFESELESLIGPYKNISLC